MTYEERSSLQRGVYVVHVPAPNLMLTDDWRGAALHYMRERVRSLLARCRAGLQTHIHTRTDLPTRHHPGCSPSIFTATTAAIKGPTEGRAGLGNGFRFVFIACLYIESADRSGRGGGEADGRMRKWQLALFNGLHVIVMQWIFRSELLRPSLIPP